MSQGKIALIALGGAVAFLLFMVGLAAIATSYRESADKPSPNTGPGAYCDVSGCRTTDPPFRQAQTQVTTPPEPSPSPSISETCSNSAAWAQDGDTSLLDAYIQNQTSGNINVEDLKATCPQYLPVWERAQGGIGGGEVHAVPDEVKPGTYETTSSAIEGCYWERGRKGQVMANNFITASTVKQRVTIRAGDDTFVSKNCGDWVKVG